MKYTKAFIKIAFSLICLTGGALYGSDKTIPNEVLIPQSLTDLALKYPDCEYLNKLIQNYDVFLEIHAQCNHQFLMGCGSYLFNGYVYDYSSDMYEKQKLLYETAKKSTKVLEVGVYMGHSLFIMLLANPLINITCIDIDDHYSRPAIGILEKKFGVQIDFIKDDSKSALALLTKTFDMFHIDGCHSSEYLNFEFKHCLTKCSQRNVYFVFDDFDTYPEDIKAILRKNNLYKVLSIKVPKCSWRNVVANLEVDQSLMMMDEIK